MSAFTTPEQIARLRQLRDAAPALPWVVEADRDGWWRVNSPRTNATWPWFEERKVFDDGSACGECSATCSEASRDYILAAAHMAPALADEVERLREQSARLRDALASEGGLCDGCGMEPASHFTGDDVHVCKTCFEACDEAKEAGND